MVSSVGVLCYPMRVFADVASFRSETDLWNYSLSLREIDKMRVDGKFVDAEGNRPTGQYVSSNRAYMTPCGVLIVDPPSGLAVPPTPMLWPHLPVTIVQRTRIRGTHADCEFLVPLSILSILTHHAS